MVKYLLIIEDIIEFTVAIGFCVTVAYYCQKSFMLTSKDDQNKSSGRFLLQKVQNFLYYEHNEWSTLCLS